jgi:ribosome maturation factor RimP
MEPDVRRIVEEELCELFDLVFVKEGVNWYLRVFIDKEDGVSIQDCERVSRAVENFLDERDPIEQAYILEVSSPGAERPLTKERDFEKYKGSLVEVKLYKAVEKRKVFRGNLVGLREGCVIIVEESGETRQFTKSDIAVCRLAILV